MHIDIVVKDEENTRRPTLKRLSHVSSDRTYTQRASSQIDVKEMKKQIDAVLNEMMKRLAIVGDYYFEVERATRCIVMISLLSKDVYIHESYDRVTSTFLLPGVSSQPEVPPKHCCTEVRGPSITS